MTKTSIGSYKVTRRLAGPGEAYLVRGPGSGRCLARLFERSPEDDDWEQTQRELKLCAALEHPAIERAKDWFVENDKLVVIYSEMDGKTLEQLLNRLLRAGKSLPEEAIWFLGHQLFGALAQAHSPKDLEGDLITICHGHLCPKTIGLGWDGSVLVEGLGLAALVGSGVQGEAGYQPPESRTTPRGDIYSAAAILWALLAREKPPATGERLSVADLDLSPGIAELLARALEPSVGKRKIIGQELEHALAQLADAEEGKAALADALGLLRKGGTLLGTGPGLAAVLGRAGVGKPGARPVRPVGRIAPPPKIGKVVSPAPPPVETTDEPAAAQESTLPALRSQQLDALGDTDAAPAKKEVVDWDTEPTTAFRRDELQVLAEKVKQEALDDAAAQQAQAPLPATADAAPVKAAPKEEEEEPPEEEPPEELLGAVVGTGSKPPITKSPAKPLRIPKLRAVKPPELSSARPPKLPEAAKVEVGSKDKDTPSPAPPAVEAKSPAPPAVEAKSPAPPAVEVKSPAPPEVEAKSPAPPEVEAKPKELSPSAPAVAAKPGDIKKPAAAAPLRKKPRAAPQPAAKEPDQAAEPSAEQLAVLSELVEKIALGDAEDAAEKQPPPAAEPAAKPAAKPADAEAAPQPPAARDAAAPAPPPASLEALEATPALDDKPGPPKQQEEAAEPVVEQRPSPAPKAPEPAPKAPEPPAEPAVAEPAVEAEDESPWKADETAAPALEPPKKLGMGTAILVALVTAGLVMGVGIWWMNRQASIRSSEIVTSAKPTATPKPKPTKTAKPKPPASSEAAPARSAAAAASASAAPTASAEVTPPDDGDDGSSLPPTEGYLIISFIGEQGGQVYAKGQPLGPVGQKIKVTCDKPTFMRIGKDVGGLGGTRWLSDGQTVVPKCQAVTTISMKPKP